MSGNNNFQKHARSLFQAGVSLLQQVSQQQRNDSSDEEQSEIADSQDFIANGQRGIVVYKTYSVKSDREKILHLNLYKAQIVQYYDSRKRTYQCEDVQSISHNSDNNIVLEVKRNMNLQSHFKKIIFQNDQLAHEFHQYIEFMNESGKSTKSAFNQIDYKRTGIISGPDLKRALAKVDLNATEQDISNMLAMGTGYEGSFDYSDFVQMFLNSFVSNLRQCLQEWLIQATATSTDSASSLAKVDTSLDALPGEVIAFAPTERVHWCVMGGKHCRHPTMIPGVMYATNYRIVLFALRKASNEKHSHSRFDVPSFFNMLSIPLTTLHRIYFAAPRNSIYFVCKDYRTVRVTLSGFENCKNKVETFVQVLQGISHYNLHSMDPRTHLFAYKNLTYFSNHEQGWNLCDLIKEYVRQGLFDAPEWKVLENKEYSLADSYPRYLVLPAQMTKDEIRIAAGFRSRARLPVVTYLHRTTGAVLTRSAQPMVGLAQKNCPEDEKLLSLYRCKGRIVQPRSEEDVFSKLWILDARGKVAATLNMAMGKGTEDVSYYPHTELIFCNIDNIHVMRNSAWAMADALSASAAYSHSARDKESQLLLDGSMSGYYTRLEESGWLRHVRLVLLSSVVVAEKLHFDGCSVLVHCSDGWDRTAQMCAIAQVLLDPYFRTIEGIATLVEKEWCAFGHKFQDRCGHAQDFNHLPDERSPVFLQFLDALYQVVAQFPNAFEYTETLLLFLADHVNSSLFGNFLGNSEKERVEALEVRLLTKSIWSYIFGKRNIFRNVHYAAYEKPIWPNCGAASVRVWERFWLRWDVSAHPNNLRDERWHDDWGNGAETDPAHVVKRSSYSFVSRPNSVSAASSSSSRRPLGVRGILPTQHSNSSFGSSVNGTDDRVPFAERNSEDHTERPTESSLAVDTAQESLISMPIEPLPPIGEDVAQLLSEEISTAEDLQLVEKEPVPVDVQGAVIEDVPPPVLPTAVDTSPLPSSTGEGDGTCASAAESGYASSNEASEDDRRERVLSERSAERAQHRAARVKNRSIEGAGALPDFKEIYDEAEDELVVEQDEQLEKEDVVQDAEEVAQAEEAAEEGSEEDPYVYPPSGKNVAFI